MPPLRFIDRLKFTVERQFVKGAGFQLLVVMLFIGLISLIGGLLVAPTGAPFDDIGTAVWWAFLRLTDPGYLGDDVGTWRRIVSTVLTVSGYVVFLGTLVAIMTRKLIAVMADLERGLTPVTLKHHIVVLGWGSRTLPLLRELLGSTGRVRRFLERNDARRLRLVVLCDNASAAQRLELKNTAGIGSKERNVILRSGTAIQPEALQRVACLDAAAVILPSRHHGPDSLVTSDVETVKALLSIAAQARQKSAPLPFVVAEVQDLRKRLVVERAYPGAVEVVAGDATISRLLTQNILHPGLSEVYNELLTGSDGNEIYIRSGDLMPGATLGTLAAQCPKAIVFGLLRPAGDGWDVMLLASPETRIQAEDRIILMARDYADTQPGPQPDRKASPARGLMREAPVQHVRRNNWEEKPDSHRVLILGWNRRVPSLIDEFGSYPQHRFDVDLVSIVPVDVRDREVRAYAGRSPRVECHHIEADYMVEAELRSLRLHEYDSILLLSSDRLASGEEADARAMVGYLQIDEILREADARPQLIIELSDAHNQSLLTVQQSEVLVSPMILSHVLAQVALRRELRIVFDELFTAGGAEILFREQEAYGLAAGADFLAFEKAAAARGEVALGINRLQPGPDGRRLQLNPGRAAHLAVQPGDLLVVLGYGA